MVYKKFKESIKDKFLKKYPKNNSLEILDLLLDWTVSEILVEIQNKNLSNKFIMFPKDICYFYNSKFKRNISVEDIIKCSLKLYKIGFFTKKIKNEDILFMSIGSKYYCEMLRLWINNNKVEYQ